MHEKAQEGCFVLTWICRHADLQHSEDAPTVAGSVVTLPPSRSWNQFTAYINPTAPNDIEVDAVESYTFTLVRVSAVVRKKRTIPVAP